MAKRIKKAITMKLQKKQEEKVSVKVVVIRVVAILIFAALLIMSTYAWFSSQKDITIYNLRGTVEVSENMEVSLDAKMWYHKIDLSKMVNDKTALQAAVISRNAAYGGAPLTAPNIEPQQLLPVSTVGYVGSTYVPFYEGTAKAKEKTSLRKIKECDEYYEQNVNAPIDNGYFAFDMYIRNTSRTDEPDVLQLNLNAALKIIEEEIEKEIVTNGVRVKRLYKGQKFSGLQNTMRVGLALYENTVDSIASQKQVLDATKGSKISQFAIWEPNAPYHVQYIIDNNNKLKGPGAPKDGFKNGDEVVTYALNSKSTQGEATIPDVYDTSDPSLGKQVTLKTEIADTKADEEDYRIKPDEDGKPIDITDIEEELLTIEANKISRVRVYVWMEGQDIDCINIASFGGGIELDLGLTKDDAIGDVLKEKDDEGLEPSNMVIRND